MKKILIYLVLILFNLFGYSQQIKVAIVDFDNTSGIAKYDGLGKAMSSMLISDIEANVSPKRLQLVERSQINKILKEQNFQKTSSVDKASTVKMGKLLGVKYLLVGDIFILNDALVINSRLVDTETGDIKFTEKKEGKLTQWLFLKTALAKGLSTSISMPFTEPVVLDKEINSAVVTTFSNAITEKDKGDLEKAESLINVAKEFDPEFKYLDDLSAEVEKLKKEVEKLKVEVETTVSNPIQAANAYLENKDYLQAIKYYLIGLNRIPDTEYGSKYAYYVFLSEAYLNNNNFIESIKYADYVLLINPFELRAIFTKANSLVKMNKPEEGILLLKKFINNSSKENLNLFLKSLYDFSMNNRSVILEGLEVEWAGGRIPFESKIQYENFEEFKAEIGPGYDSNLFLIISSDYEFKQNYGFDELIYFYTELLSNAKINPILIAKSIDEFEWGNNNSNPYDNMYKTGIYGNTMTGLIEDKNLYVIAKTGEPYFGPAHFNSYGIAEMGVYSNKNLKVNSFKITSDESILEFKKKTGINQFKSAIECPCNTLLEKKVYDEIKKNNTTIFVNNFNDASKYINSAWFFLIGRQYKASIERFQAVVNFYIKFSRSLDGKDMDKSNFDKYRMTIINLGHAYLLDGNYQKAYEIYSNNIFYKDFGDDWNNLSSEDIIKNDWNDFIDKGLVTKSQIREFNNKNKIINNFD